MSRQVDRLAQAIVRRLAITPPPRGGAGKQPGAAVASRTARPLRVTIASAVSRPRGAVASVAPRALRAAVASAATPLRQRRPNLAAAVASAVARRLAPAAAVPERALVASRIASTVARQVASRTTAPPVAAGPSLTSLDPAKVAAAVIGQLDALKGKTLDHNAILASQIVRRLASAKVQGSTPNATQFAGQLASAVVAALAQQQTPKTEETSGDTSEQPQGTSTGEQSASKSKKSP
jgi:hypothetical protein